MTRIRILEQDDRTILAMIDSEAGSLVIIANVRLEEDRVILYDFHVDGPGPSALGPGRLRGLADRLMEEYDVEQLEIQGFRRTSGANPGRQPAPIRFRRRG